APRVPHGRDQPALIYCARRSLGGVRGGRGEPHLDGWPPSAAAVASSIFMTHSADEQVAGATLKERTVGRGWQLFEAIDDAYERGEIDAAEWPRRIGAIIGPAYLAATNPRAQSGASGTAEEWEKARRFIFAPVNRDGTFLDVGCANGHLMEC